MTLKALTIPDELVGISNNSRPKRRDFGSDTYNNQVPAAKNERATVLCLDV
jgi:hypothetical protein